MKKHLFKTFAMTMICLNVVSVTAQNERINISCVGNSITEGVGTPNPATDSYPVQLGNLLGDGYNVGNFGVAGRTLLHKGDFPYWNEQKFIDSQTFNPNIVIIKLGTNDTKPQNWVYGSEYIHDLREMVDIYKNLSTHPTIYLCYPAKAHTGSFGISDATIVNEVMPAIDMVAAENNLNIIDFHSAFTYKPSLYDIDGIHPNKEGAAVMAEIVKKTLIRDKIQNRSFEDQSAENNQPDGWQTTNNTGSPVSGEATDGKNCYNLSATNGQTAELWQSVTNIPVGTYTLKADVFTDETAGQSIYVQVNDAEAIFASPEETGKWTTLNITFTVTSKTDVIRIGAIAGQSMKLDNFYIDYVAEGLINIYKPILDTYCETLENLSANVEGTFKNTVQTVLDKSRNPGNDDDLYDNSISEVCKMIDVVKAYNHVLEYGAILDISVAPEATVASFNDVYSRLIDMLSIATELTSDINESINDMYTAFAEYLKEAQPKDGNTAIDLTFMIKNAEVSSGEGWNNAYLNYNQQYLEAPDNTYLDLWNGVLDTYQNIILPQGYYRLTAATRASVGIAESYLYMSVDGERMIKNGHQADGVGNTLGNGWGWTELNAYIPKDGADIAIGYYANASNYQWASVDNFKLEKIYYGSVTEETGVDLTAYAGNSKQDWHGTGVYAALDNIAESAGLHRTGTLFYQTVNGLPNGVYSVELQAAASQAWSTQLVSDGTDNCTFAYANHIFEQSVPVYNRTEVSENELGTYRFDHILVTDGKLEMGMRNDKQGANWALIRIKSLTYYGDDKELILDGLSKMIPEAEKLAEKLAATSLTEAIDKAKSVNTDSELTDILSAAEELNSAVKLTKTLIVDYEDIRVVMESVIEKAGTLNDTFDKVTFETAINDITDKMSMGEITDKDATISLLYNVLADAAKSQSFEAGSDMTYAIINPSFETGDLTGWVLPFGASADTKVVQPTGNYHTNGTDGEYMFNMWWQGLPIEQEIEKLPAGKYTLSAFYTGQAPDISGFYMVTNGTPSRKFTTETAGTFQEVSTTATVGEDGRLTIRVQGSNQAGDYTTNDFWYWYKVDNFRLSPLACQVTADITEDMKWSTLILPFNAGIPAGLKVYSCNGFNENQILVLKEETSIEANKPYIVYGPGEYVFNGYDSSYKNEYADGLLTGKFETASAPIGTYVLQEKDGKPAFCKVTSDSPFTIGTNQCYIVLSEDDAATTTSLFLPDMEATSVKDINGSNQFVDVYSVNGILLKSNVDKNNVLKGLKKGVYIVK